MPKQASESNPQGNRNPDRTMKRWSEQILELQRTSGIQTMWLMMMMMIITLIIFLLLFKEDEVGGTYGTHGGGERFLQGFGWRPEGKKLLRRPRRRWESNIKMDLRQIGIDEAN
jgi:hypothetical protein